jgi:hypothetical protein
MYGPRIVGAITIVVSFETGSSSILGIYGNPDRYESHQCLPHFVTGEEEVVWISKDTPWAFASCIGKEEAALIVLPSVTDFY